MPRAWMAAGWETSDLNLTGQTVWFRRVRAQKKQRSRMPDRPNPDEVIQGLTTKSSKIRALADAGYDRAEISRILDLSYHHVYSVLWSHSKRDLKAWPDGRIRRQDVIDNRVDLLIRDFERYVLAFDEKPAFTRSGQLENHVKTIRLRYNLGSVSAAMQSSEFLDCLWSTLVSWGIGSRASRLVEPEQFAEVLQRRAFAISELEDERLDSPGLRVQSIADKVWAIIDALGIVENKAKLVPCTKALHHLLPELIVPMDREYTGAYFGWRASDFQDRQERTIHHAFERFAQIASSVNPRQYVGSGWRTSVTKVIDNAIVAFCRIENLMSPSRGSVGTRMSNNVAQKTGVGKAKGKTGESCAQALQDSIESGEVVGFTDLFERVKAKGSWSDDTISLHLMSCVVNLPPARRRWPSRKPFLFLRPDGRYELYNQQTHAAVLE